MDVFNRKNVGRYRNQIRCVEKETNAGGHFEFLCLSFSMSSKKMPGPKRNHFFLKKLFFDDSTKSARPKKNRIFFKKIIF